MIGVTNKIVQTLAPEFTALPPKYPVSYDNLEKCLIAQIDSLYSIKFKSAGALTFQKQNECKHSSVCQAPSRWNRNVGLTVPQTDNLMWRGGVCPESDLLRLNFLDIIQGQRGSVTCYVCWISINLYLDITGYLHHIVWKLLEAAGAGCIVMHSFGVGKMFISLGQFACVSRRGNSFKQLTKSLPHRAMWQASSMALTNLLPVNFRNVMALWGIYCYASSKYTAFGRLLVWYSADEYSTAGKL